MEFFQKDVQPLPFFMTYPGYAGVGKDANMLQDLEYLQQTYPQEVKKYQRKVAEILDRMDYEGSMIYDEYPDQYCLRRLTKAIIQILQKEEQDAQVKDPTSAEKWTWLESMIQVLLCNEICKRRHGGKRGFFTI